jgi:hypothetical protein
MTNFLVATLWTLLVLKYYSNELRLQRVNFKTVFLSTGKIIEVKVLHNKTTYVFSSYGSEMHKG